MSVTSDLVSDNRVHKVCTSLVKMGFDVLLTGRKSPDSRDIAPRAYPLKRFRLLVNRGPVFYAFYNFRLFFLLLFSRSNLLLSNDLDTLPANFFISKIKRIPLVYDSHEFFTEVPELVDRPWVRGIWEWLERKMLPHICYAYTVSGSIARHYQQKYGISFRIVRNCPYFVSAIKEKEPQESSGKIIIYQGVLNVSRGLEQAVSAMRFIEGARLLLAGDGIIKEVLEKQVQKEGLENKVVFLGRLPLEDLSEFTCQADLGLSLEEDVGLNYRYALPNKLFDYIQARVPVLVSGLPEMAALVNHYQIGETADSLKPRVLAGKMTEMLYSEECRQKWKKNLEKAAKELTWEKEEKVLQEIFRPFL